VLGRTGHGDRSAHEQSGGQNPEGESLLLTFPPRSPLTGSSN
jgi:hypothetical protein